MFNIYDKCESIDFKCYRNENWIHFPYMAEISDNDDSLTISTAVVMDDIDRGWIGDITFNLSGFDLSDNEHTAFRKVKFMDVLCIRRTFNKHHDETAIWEYTFLKY